MYVYHEYFNAKCVVLIYPSQDEETRITKGEFMANENQMKSGFAGNGNIFSVLKLHTDINKWQEHIYNMIINFMAVDLS